MGFKSDFMWGAASAAYQLEGAYLDDGKGMGIWDTYSNELKGKVKHNETGNRSCDHYHKFREDVAMMKEVGLKFYRFSISWPRVMPNGKGEVNQKGIQFYSDLIDCLLENGIEPMVTIFHWNYPQNLQELGGWLNDESPKWFAEYTKVLVDNFSDRVKYWLTINEPQCFIGLGYLKGEFAPFMKLRDDAVVHMAHNVLRAHGSAVKTIRQYAKQDVKISMAPMGPCFAPENDSAEAIEKARKMSFDVSKEGYTFSNSFWSDPVYLGKYPDKAFELFPTLKTYIKDGDMELISQELDFCGVNIYNTMGYGVETEDGSYLSNQYMGNPITQMGWSVSPETLYWSPKFLYERYKKPILITENGMASHDWVCLDGKVHDSYRVDYLHRYIRELQRANDDGVDIIGYLCWSIMDNFEWADGYDKRFGLIYVDYKTGERVIKDSAYWYKETINCNGSNL